VRRRGAGLPRVIRLAAGCELVHLENRAFSAVRQHADPTVIQLRVQLDLHLDLHRVSKEHTWCTVVSSTLGPD